MGLLRKIASAIKEGAEAEDTEHELGCTMRDVLDLRERLNKENYTVSVRGKEVPVKVLVPRYLYYEEKIITPGVRYSIDETSIELDQDGVIYSINIGGVNHYHLEDRDVAVSKGILIQAKKTSLEVLSALKEQQEKEILGVENRAFQDLSFSR